MNLPTLRQLQYLVAVVELKHFGQAAERCFVSQSTLSAAIQELESLLGATLLERSKRKVVPTSLGIELASKARRIIMMSSELVEMAKGLNEPLVGSLKLGIIPTIGPFLLPFILPEIRQRFPKLELKLIEGQSEDLVDKVEKGLLDTAIIAFPYPIRGMKQHIFWQENFLLVMPKGHDLESVDPIETGQLPSEELLLLEQGHCLTDHALAACRLEDMKASVAFEGTSLYTLVQMVIGGQGMTFVPEMALWGEGFSLENVSLSHLSDQGHHREIGLFWRNSYFREADLLLLSETIQQVLKKKGKQQLAAFCD
jgi:LysR family transcriptional regulator, hydrogen peroxide-inducible genes activator